MAGEAELESLVVALKADVEQFRAGMDESVSKAQETASNIEQSASKIESFVEGVKGFASAAVDALAAIGGKELLEDFFSEFSAAERAALDLRATLRAQGRDVDALSAHYVELSGELQQLYAISDEAIQGLFGQAEAFGLTGAAAERAANDAIGLAKGNEQLAMSTIRVSQAVAQGDIKRAMMFSRQIKELRGVRDEAEFLAKYEKLVAAGLESAAEAADTASGQFKLLDLTFGDFKEQLGEIVAQALKPIAQMAVAAAKAFQGLSPEIKLATVASIALSVAVVGIAAALKAATLAGIGFNLATGGMLIAIGAVVTAGIGIALWVSHLGGVEKAWERVKDAGQDFWNWFRPVWRAFEGFVSQVGRNFRQSVEMIYGFAKAVAKAIEETFDFKIEWDDVRNAIAGSLIAGEFMLMKFSNTAELASISANISFTTMTEKIAHFFVNTMPEMLDYFKRAWVQSFTSAASFATEAISKIGSILDKLRRGQIGQALAAARSLPQDLRDAAEREFQKMPDLKLTPYEPSAELIKLFDDLNKALKEGQENFGAFFAKRMAEIMQKEADQAKRKDQDRPPPAFQRGIDKLVASRDAVQIRSAEAASRIRAFAEGNNESPEVKGGNRREAILKDIRDELKGKDAFELEGLNLS